MSFLTTNPDAIRVIKGLDFLNPNISIPSLENSKKIIYNINFQMLIYKLCTPDPNISRLWSEETAAQAILLYKNWLWLIRKYGENNPILPPSIEIDAIWHHHILDTYKYHEDCLQIFGQYFHHYPYFGMRGSADFQNLSKAFEITQHLYFLEFGEYIHSFDEDSEEIELEISL